MKKNQKSYNIQNYTVKINRSRSIIIINAKRNIQLIDKEYRFKYFKYPPICYIQEVHPK